MSLSSSRILARIACLAELAFFPSFCKLCGRLLESPRERVLCRACLEKIKPLRTPLCPCCGRFYEGVGKDHYCSSCMEKTPPFSIHRSCARYRDSLKDAILLMKYRGYRTLGKDLARFASEALKKEELLWQGVDALVPVPLHPRRLRERGFNQAQVLSLEIGRLKGIPVEAGVLRKIRNVPPQTLLQQNERIQNVRGVYEIGRRAHIAGRIYLLVDDVFTTGSTIGECAAVLKKAGAREVRAVSIAQA